MRGLVLEGVTASGKTTLFAALQRALLDARPAATKIVLSEHYTDRLLEEPRKHGRLAVSDAIGHVEDVMSTVATLARLEAGGKFAGRGGDAGVYVLVERFLGSHMAYLAGLGRAPDAGERARIVGLYERLGAAGLRVVVLRLSPDVLPDAVLRTRSHRSSAWRAWLRSHGDDDAAVVGWFQAWQANLLAFYASLPASLRPEIVDVPRPGDATDAAALARRWVDSDLTNGA